MEMRVEDAFRRSIPTLMDWISQEVNLSRTHLIFRTYAPVHFRYFFCLNYIEYCLSISFLMLTDSCNNYFYGHIRKFTCIIHFSNGFPNPCEISNQPIYSGQKEYYCIFVVVSWQCPLIGQRRGVEHRWWLWPRDSAGFWCISDVNWKIHRVQNCRGCLVRASEGAGYRVIERDKYDAPKTRRPLVPLLFRSCSATISFPTPRLQPLVPAWRPWLVERASVCCYPQTGDVSCA